MRSVLFVLAALAALSSPALAQEAPKSVVLVTIDGLRWEELFRGADPDLVRDDETRARYIDVPDRAQALAPFLLSFTQTGALIGNRDAGSCARVSNAFWFSYPGYAEMLGGRPNPRVRYNAAIPNDDVTVLERLIRRPEFAGQVRVFAEWNAVPAIVNAERSGIPVSLPPEYDAPHDPQVMTAVREVLPTLPRVTWINLGGTDTNAHAGRYADYLASASAADAFLSELWAAIEANPRTAGRTTLIVTTDHGRGAAVRNRWRGHGSGRWRGIVVPGLRHVGSDAVWIAARGPGIGSGAYDLENCATISQVAATMLRSIDLDEERQPDMAQPLDVFTTTP
jgi:hypothetical protein